MRGLRDEMIVRGPKVSLHGSNPEPLMSALGHKRTLKHVRLMSALPPKADIGTQLRNVRFVPKADICAATKKWLFDHLVGECQQFVGNLKAKCLRGGQVED